LLDLTNFEQKAFCLPIKNRRYVIFDLDITKKPMPFDIYQKALVKE